MIYFSFKLAYLQSKLWNEIYLRIDRNIDDIFVSSVILYRKHIKKYIKLYIYVICFIRYLYVFDIISEICCKKFIEQIYIILVMTVFWDALFRIIEINLTSSWYIFGRSISIYMYLYFNIQNERDSLLPFNNPS